MDWMDLLQPFLMTVLQVLLPVVLAFLVAWLRAKTQEIIANVDSEKLYMVRKLAESFVKAAEQTGLAEGVKRAGAEKKAEVLALLQAYCNANGIKLSVAELSAMIEAEVVDAFGYSRPEQVVP